VVLKHTLDISALVSGPFARILIWFVGILLQSSFTLFIPRKECTKSAEPQKVKWQKLREMHVSTSDKINISWKAGNANKDLKVTKCLNYLTANFVLLTVFIVNKYSRRFFLSFLLWGETTWYVGH
jgi:hypothetical protein